jgi:hypothetical protein
MPVCELSPRFTSKQKYNRVPHDETVRAKCEYNERNKSVLYIMSSLHLQLITILKSTKRLPNVTFSLMRNLTSRTVSSCGTRLYCCLLVNLGES